MGWANCGTDRQGRAIGYATEAVCDKEGCSEEIDRGVDYACGGMHGDDEHSCERYFCYSHLVYVVKVVEEDQGSGTTGVRLGSPQLCEECAEWFGSEEA